MWGHTASAMSARKIQLRTYGLMCFNAVLCGGSCQLLLRAGEASLRRVPEAFSQARASVSMLYWQVVVRDVDGADGGELGGGASDKVVFGGDFATDVVDCDNSGADELVVAVALEVVYDGRAGRWCCGC